ncbi:Floral homeotic protein PMADS 2 [Morus notabilis]|uniref:Floral homeotic protein PMADS 2 n=1 Tax=Morus notabilis TaxID=981085 RepID=W9QXU5_9ROSA|nr:Floral homeotic protein PMADS 2 [Morus notabilis]
MGRGKIEIKRIENSTNRHVTLSKRKKGLIKKASEISVLCDAKVSIIISTSSSKAPEHYCSPTTSLSFILEEYQRLSGQKLWDVKHENLNNEIDMTKKENENMEIDLRHMKGQEIQSLNIRELIGLERTLENGLTSADFLDHLRQKDKILGAENKRLTYELCKMEMEGQGMDNGRYNDKMRDYNPLPYAFHVQPMQPNLQGM